MTERSSTILYSDGLSDSTLEATTSAISYAFTVIEAEDRLLPTPIVDRQLGIAVALKPDYEGPDDIDAVLATIQIGEFDRPELLEKFILKGLCRAFWQKSRGIPTDVAPAEQLYDIIPDDSLYMLASASVNGLSASFTGPWPHHSRQLAAACAGSLAYSLELPTIRSEGLLYSPHTAAKRLMWFNNQGQGRDACDNTPLHELKREQYRPILQAIIK